MHPSRPNTLFIAKHWDVMRSDDAGDLAQVSSSLPSDFGFPISVHAHEPETIYVIPIKSDSSTSAGRKLRVYRSRTGGNEWEALTNGLPQRDCYVNILRDAMSVDTLESCRICWHDRRTRSMHRRTRATAGLRLSVIFRPSPRWKCRRWHDPGRVASPPANAGEDWP
ncbi:MAG: hypothetical protein R2849_15770 [Thermomicrobiales bacterium]